MIKVKHFLNIPHCELPYKLFQNGKSINEVSLFLEQLFAQNFSSTTIRAYAYDLLSFYKFLSSADLSLNKLKEKDGIKFISKLRSLRNAPRTINRRITIVRCFLNSYKPDLGNSIFQTGRSRFYKGRRNKALLGPGRIKDNSKNYLKIKVPHKLLSPVSSRTIKFFAKKMQSYRDRAIFILILCLGLRANEVLTLHIYDIDFSSLQIRINGKGNKERLLPITQKIKDTINLYLRYERPETIHKTCFVVLKGPHRAMPLTYGGLRQIFRYYRKKSSIFKNLHPHYFRHIFCTNLIKQGVAIPVVQKLMGHADIETTLNYINLTTEDIAQEYFNAMKALEKDYETL